MTTYTINVKSVGEPNLMRIKAASEKFARKAMKNEMRRAHADNISKFNAKRGDAKCHV